MIIDLQYKIYTKEQYIGINTNIIKEIVIII
jgi:hypothetical protein